MRCKDPRKGVLKSSDQLGEIMISPAKDGIDPSYLGDGAYVQMDPYGHQLWITAENGIGVQHAIALGPNELRALINYARSHEIIK